MQTKKEYNGKNGAAKTAHFISLFIHNFRCKTLIFSSEEECLQKQMVDEGLADGYFVKNHSFDGLKEAIDPV